MTMKNNYIYQAFGLALGLVSLALAWYFYGWQLPVILFLFAWSMNIAKD